MKTYVHARLGSAEREVLDELKEATGKSDSELVREGLHLLAETSRRQMTARELAGTSVGKFAKGPRDLSTSPRHLEGFGE